MRDRPPDALDVAVALLKKRDGVDKVLKLFRYATIFAVSEAKRMSRTAKDSSGAESVTVTEFIRAGTALERSIGSARRVYRVGKFLGNAQDLRDAIAEAEASGKRGYGRFLNAACACAALEGAYYFLEQGVWLSRAGVVMRERTTLERLIRWSARAEVASYVFSIACALEEYRDALAEEKDARDGLVAATSRTLAIGVKSEGDIDDLQARLAGALKAKRGAIRSICTDAADATLSVEDAVDVEGFEITNERFVNVLGLLTAVLDFSSKLEDAVDSFN
ncbi:Peroxisomal biogenesis factor 11 [Ostreococcus tauri]|uniref:Peroxisomal biogenesis factor 11 n=1 Tax=Ostreococcus tauri TaxID=70448 RepID=Q00ZQ4_OSTTA|nr:Peroxisomal biogenesis factor 11 [Ostreococcus tauri]OUS43249.1 putative PEX11-3 protein [Ostreococcus tauri]CAL56228.1 Peroxisomal biogenesis factor 11 [Ostreococcus tauri]|eukprot:XP_003081704.1 Peroxisomal biogenesis factor 11 [Ostreococcus tauri]